MTSVAQKSKILSIESDGDVVQLRQTVRTCVKEVGLSLVDETKVVTAACELARNMLSFAGGGTVQLETIADNGRRGVRMIFTDHGPGIPDVELAMKHGYSTGPGLGIGLNGAKKLMDEFDLASQEGEGTQVSVTKWK